MVEPPHEFKKIKEGSVEFLSTACWKIGARPVHYATNDYARQAGQPRRIKPDDQIGTGQTQVESASGIIAFADPGTGCDRIADPFTELHSIGLDPARLPEQGVQVHYRQVESLVQGASQSGLAAACIAQNHNPLHEGLPVAKMDGDSADYYWPVNSAGTGANDGVPPLADSGCLEQEKNRPPLADEPRKTEYNVRPIIPGHTYGCTEQGTRPHGFFR